jgi:glycogen debranching enzyme
MSGARGKVEELQAEQEGYQVYWAGLPRYPRNFTRDGVIAGLLANDAKLLEKQLAYSAVWQGKKVDSVTGEEPGKMHHERPGFAMRGLLTTYNACDTTALWLIGLKRYQELIQSEEPTEKYREQILQAVQYIQRHIQEGFFVEDPKYVQAERFALRVTYWKDSVLAERPGGEPQYPVMYTLAQVINLAGLRAAQHLLATKEFSREIDLMRKRLRELIEPSGKAVIVRDAEGDIEVPSSDWLQALYYLEPGDVSEEQLMLISQLAEELETEIGYQSLSAAAAEELADQYHGQAVWPFEQALIHYGAKKFNLPRISEVSKRIRSRLESEPELLQRDEQGKWQPAGNDPQLWTLAAKSYFEGVLS